MSPTSRLSFRTSKAETPLCTALASLLADTDATPPVRKVGAAPKDPSQPNAEAVAASHYPSRPQEAVDWSLPLFDSEGYEHRLVELGGVQVVTRISFAFAIWDRRTLTLVSPEADAGHTIGNTPLPPAERERRRAEAAQMLADMHAARTAASDQAGPADAPRG